MDYPISTGVTPRWKASFADIAARMILRDDDAVIHTTRCEYHNRGSAVKNATRPRKYLIRLTCFCGHATCFEEIPVN